jgi:hypothetical protein
MKKISILALFLAVLMIGFSSCKKSASSTTTNLDTGAQQVTSAMSVQFSASQTGDGVITTLTYVVGSTSKTVTNPTLPWTVTVDASAGDNVSMTAVATTTNGSAKITYYGSNGTQTVQGQDSVSTSSTK